MPTLLWSKTVKSIMYIQTLGGDVFSIDPTPSSMTLDVLKQSISEIDPLYHPFCQFLFPLWKGPLRPLREGHDLGLFLQPIRIKLSKSKLRILLNESTEQFPTREKIARILWLFTVSFIRKKGTPKKVVKHAFVYDPYINQFALSASFLSAYHRFEPHYVFLLSNETVRWYSTLQEVLLAFQQRFPTLPVTEPIMEKILEKWIIRKEQLLSVEKEIMDEFWSDVDAMHDTIQQEPRDPLPPRFDYHQDL